MTSIPCQGLPDRPCPKMRCDSTVPYSIYDLFLCEYCERIRAKEKKREKINKLKVPTDTKDHDRGPHKQTERSTEIVAILRLHRRN